MLTPGASFRLVALRSLASLPERSAQSKPVHKYTAAKTKHRKRVYGWGLSLSGALGVPELAGPVRANKSLKRTFVPCRLPFKEEQEVTHVSGGFGFSLFAVKKGAAKVYGCGVNTCGQIGFQPAVNESLRTRQWILSPEPIVLPVDDKASVISISCGRVHSLVATDKGLFAMGNNAQGQCGRPVIENEDYAGVTSAHKVPLPDDGRIKQVAAGFDHSVVLMEDGRVFTFGLGADGQLGNEAYEFCWRPQLVQGDIAGEKIVQVSSVADTVLAVSEHGQLFGWGNSEYQQLMSDVPQSAVPRHLDFGPQKVVCAAAGGSACALVTDSGELHVWGYGLIGQGPEVTLRPKPSLIPLPIFGRNEVSDVRVKSVTAGLTHFAAINSQDELFMWGRNKAGLLGLGHERDQFFPFRVSIGGHVLQVACATDHTLAITRNLI